MNLWDAFVLGVVQGISEWLPVSSSGHLVLFREFFSLEGSVSYDIFLHFSALIVISVFFHRDITKVSRAFFSFRKDTYEFRIGLYIVYATIMTGVVGILLRPHLESLGSLHVVRFTFLAISLLLFASRRTLDRKINLKTALFIGLMQGFALLPGISRSGATISAAKIAGAGNEEAFNFSFLLAMPAIAAAVLFEIGEFRSMPVDFLITGFISSLLLGLVSLYFLKRMMLKGKFYVFGFYTLALSVFIFLFNLSS